MPVPFYTGEIEPLTLREARCHHCSRIFYICRYCDRGQHYCSIECRTTRQKKIRPRANRRHQLSREGRRDHADRQRRYRLLKKVTDVGRLPLEESDKVCPSGPQSGRFDSARRSIALGTAAPVCCARCGRAGKFVRVGPLRRLRVRKRDRALRGRGAGIEQTAGSRPIF
jgi:hypothetical protein